MAFDITRTVAISSRSVQVTFNSTPIFISPIGPNDAQNPSLWTITAPDSSTVPVLRVMFSRSIGATVIVTTYQDWTDDALWTVSAVNLKSTRNESLGVNLGQFYGIPVDHARADVQAGLGMVDLKNSPTPESPSGCLVTGTSGDYLLEKAGDKLFRKLILRRLSTATGAFFHLPAYGKGLREKNFYRDRDLVGLQKAVLDEIRQEPEAEDARVVVTISNDGELIIQAQVRQKSTNNSTTLTYPVARF